MNQNELDELEERWTIKNIYPIEECLVLTCDEWPWFPTGPNAPVIKIHRKHSQYCIEHGYSCGVRIQGDPPHVNRFNNYRPKVSILSKLKNFCRSLISTII
jgi:hypothetical protein